MKKNLTAIALFLVSVLVSFFAESAPPSNNSSPQGETVNEFISPWEHDTLKVGYVTDTGFVYEDRANHKVGYGYEYMEFLGNYAHCDFEYIEYKNWVDLTAAWEKKEIDLMPSMPGDYHKVPNAVRTEHVVGRFPMELVTKNREIKPHMKIGIVATNYPTPGFSEIAKSENFTYDEISFPTFVEMIAAYNNGEIDGYIDAFLSSRSAKDSVAFFDRQSYRLIVHADDKVLLDRMNLAMDQMLLIQSGIRDRLNQKYTNKDGFPLLLSKDEREYLAARKKLKAAIFIYYQPLAYHDENGKLVGLSPELVERISKDLGIEIEIVETHSIKETHDLIQSGGVDIVVDAILDHSWGNESNINLTQSYLTYEYAAATREGYVLDVNKKPVVACVDNMIYTRNILIPNTAPECLLHCSSWEECLEAVSDGRADVTYILKSAIQPLINETGTYGLEISPTTYFTEPCSLGVNSYENSHLWNILNKEINHIDNSWISNVLNKHRQATTTLTPMWFIYHHPMRVIIFITLLAIGIGWFIIYRNKMQRRHFELVEHMAYTDLRYELPNVPKLERDVPELYETLKADNPNLKTFFVIFSINSGATIAEKYGRTIIRNQFMSMAKQLAESEFVIMTAAGIDIDHLICFCRADSTESIANWAESVIKNFSYMETADAQAKIVLHVKAGVTSYTPAIYIQQAVDRALTACHNQSNDGVKIFDEKLEEQLTSRHWIESKMEKALRDGEFKAFYQPKYDLRTRRIVGAEALVRWISPESGFMPPGKFIPLFEENGFVIQVDYYILEETFKLQKERLAAGKEVIPISVNQSRLHMTEENYLEKMKAIVEKYKLPPGLVELEITETMFGDFDNKVAQKNAEFIVRGLHALGFSISVDDFGSGYSSFSLLGSLPMEVMKIDRSVLTGADKSNRMKEILSYVIDLGKALRMEVLCEGIETREQEILLMNLGCNLGQGFFNAKPMPVNDFVEFFEKRNAEVDAGTVVIPN